MDPFFDTLHDVFGLNVEPKSFTVGQAVLRAAIIYVAGLVLLRISENRFLGKKGAFDVLLAFILGSLLSRSINGAGPLFLTLASAAGLIGLHWLFAWIAFHSRRFERWIKGDVHRLVHDGQIEWASMRRSLITRDDLHEALRSNASLDDPGQVHLAQVECNGDISIVPRPSGPRVIDVAVEPGIQTVRIELHG